MNNNKKYSSKHYRYLGDKKIIEKIKIITVNRCISCKNSHVIASKYNINPKTVGKNIDILGIKINKCQLGLFGHNNKIKPAKTVSPKLKTFILNNQNNGKLDCICAWLISEKLNLKKINISIACENMAIRISNCQLGAF